MIDLTVPEAQLAWDIIAIFLILGFLFTVSFFIFVIRLIIAIIIEKFNE